MADPFNPYAACYVTPKGPGDDRPTAERVLADNNAFDGSWAGRVVLITGGTNGIGVETVRAMHSTGADVYFTARDLQRGLDLAEEIRKKSSGKGKLDVILMDMDSLQSVKNAGKDFLRRSEKLNVLINNAGIMGTPQSATKDGFERQFGVNHLAHFALTGIVLPALIAASSPEFNSRIVNVSSSSHRYSSIHWDDYNLTAPGKYDPYLAYGQSKTANIWMANYIDRTYGAAGVHALSLHPGAIWTGLQAFVVEELVTEWKKDPEIIPQMLSVEQGAATTVWAAAGKVWEGKGGEYLSNCSIALPSKNLTSALDDGVGPDAHNPEGEARLWELSMKLTGVTPPKA